MRIRVVAVGRLKPGPERELAERYRDRAQQMARALGFSGPEIVELPESRRRRAEERILDEEAAIRERVGASRVAVLDEGAEPLGSEPFARRLATLRDGGLDLAFVVGGPDGLAPSLKREGFGLSFGRFTLPHQLVRVLLLEQVYRAFTIIGGHPYHRAGTGES